MARPRPGAAVLARDGRIRLGEILEQFSLLVGSHTDARIRDPEYQPVLISCLAAFTSSVMVP